MSDLIDPPVPLGAQMENGGVRFSLFSRHASGIDLCLFASPTSVSEQDRIPLKRVTDSIWSCHVPGAGPDTLYGYRVDGPYAPEMGHRFNASKVLADPYARALARPLKWDDRWLDYQPHSQSFQKDTRDNSEVAPLCRVTDSAFDWQNDLSPKIPWEETILYETHVKGMTRLHPEVPEELQGSFLGLASEPVIDHLKQLGVTTLELLPVHQKADEAYAHKLGVSNYWGYSTLLYFAPDLRFARQHPDDPAREFKLMVRALHKAGIEVILDVVFNHTAEGGADGPTLSWRGIDNTSYYRLDPKQMSRYPDYTGCGNMLNTQHPAVLNLVLSSLRFWVNEMHVDGFRFDLATTLGRNPEFFDSTAPFFQALQADPVLANVKLIAEPWDMGPDGYQLTSFPPNWSEWNDQYRDTARKFWRGDSGMTGLFARRLSGSADMFKPKNKWPRSSINLITCHDGFTLTDWTRYDDKHNEANREGNRDGTQNNYSDSFGQEGPSNDPVLCKSRTQQRGNLMATLLLSLGTPMIRGGDELSQTQQGNNNTWCQDNETSWLHWNLDAEGQEFLNFTRTMVTLRKKYPVLRAQEFLRGALPDNTHDVHWLKPDGTPMGPADWDNVNIKCFGCWLTGKQFSNPGQQLLIFFNARRESCEITLPEISNQNRWTRIISTAEFLISHDHSGGSLPGPSLVVFESGN